MAKKVKQPTNLANDEHDEDAMREAERRMLLHEEHGSDGQDPRSGEAATSDLGGEHDEEALEEASERMLPRRERR
jgi:ABC-type phosphonate transport system ATPase subunit